MGPLQGVKVIEFAGIGPGPMCCMLLADMGAEVLRVDRVANVGRDPMEPRFNTLLRGRPNVALDLKKPDAVEAARALCERADILIEGFRPGVMERLGLGPEAVMARNPRLVYGRMTGWGQDGPIAHTAGHDINYIALTGALHAIGTRAGGPVPPLNLVGDFGGGALYMAMGALAAYIEAGRSGQGQVVDTSMVEGAASLMTSAYGALASGAFVETRESNRSRRWLPPLQRLRDVGRRARLHRLQRAAVLQPDAGVGRPGRRDLARADGSLVLAQDAREAGRSLQDPHPRRMDRAPGAGRCLLRPGAPHERGSGPPPQRRAGQLRGAGWRAAARPGAPVQPDAFGDWSRMRICRRAQS